MAFIDNPNSLPCVNHINECKADNRVENLEWVDYKTNNTYGSLPERKRERQIEIKGRKVTRYNLDGSVSKSYICTNDVEKDGYNRRQIDSCCKGKCKTSYGYVWRYDSDPFSLESRFIGVAKYDMSGNLVCCYESIMKAERENGLSKHAIRNYHKGIRKSNIINNYRYEILNNSTQTSGLEFRRKQNINK